MARGDYYSGVDNKRGGNAFSRAAGSTSGGMSVPSPAGSSTLPTSRKSSGFSPLLASDGPLARAGWIGALLAQGPSRSEHIAQQGADFYQRATTFMQDQAPKVGAQRAILNFIQSPDGNSYLANGGDPQELGRIASMAVSEQQAARRSAAFQGGAGQQAPASVQQPPVENNDPFGGMRAPGETFTPAAAPKGSQGEIAAPQQAAGIGYSAEHYTKVAETLAAQGDDEGSKIALQLAEQARLIETMRQPPTTDDLKEYDRYRKQEEAAGRVPMDWIPYITKIKSAGAPQTNLNTVEGMDAAQRKARLELDKKTAEETGAMAAKAAQAEPLLQQAEKIAASAPGGYAGQLTPYLSRIASGLGMKVPEGWADSEALYSISMQLMPLVRQPGQVSNYEQMSYMNALPSLAQSVEGRQKIITMMRKQIARSQEIANIYREYMGSDELPKKLEELNKKPMFDKDETKTLEEYGGHIPDMKTPEDAMKLPAGSLFRDPSGKVRRVPRPEAKKPPSTVNSPEAAGSAIGGMVPQR